MYKLFVVRFPNAWIASLGVRRWERAKWGKSMAKQSNRVWYIYLLECKGGKIYCGISTDVEKRFKRHLSGRGAKFTKRNTPSHILAFKKCRDRSEACKLEWAVKKLKPAQKRSAALEWKQTQDKASCATDCR